MDTATCFRMSDPMRNPAFRRRWTEPFPAPPTPAPATHAADEPALVTLAHERDEWLRRQASPTSRKGAAR